MLDILSPYILHNHHINIRIYQYFGLWYDTCKTYNFLINLSYALCSVLGKNSFLEMNWNYAKKWEILPLCIMQPTLRSDW